MGYPTEIGPIGKPTAFNINRHKSELEYAPTSAQIAQLQNLNCALPDFFLLAQFAFALLVRKIWVAQFAFALYACKNRVAQVAFALHVFKNTVAHFAFALYASKNSVAHFAVAFCACKKSVAQFAFALCTFFLGPSFGF